MLTAFRGDNLNITPPRITLGFEISPGRSSKSIELN
jgi:hypothetical protein